MIKLLKILGASSLSNIILNVKNLIKIFNNRLAINNISFQIEEGEIFGLLGPSGSGKSIVMRIISGLTPFNKGSISICNVDLKKNYKQAISHVGSYVVTPKFYNYMSGYGNLKYLSKLNKTKLKKQEILNITKLVGLEGSIHKYVSSYSVGMKQRLGIAQALLNKPKLLIFDEPFTGLDLKGINDMCSLLKEIAKQENIAILISSHMLGEMEKVCDTVCIMNNGQIQTTRTLAEIKNEKESAKKLKITVDYPNFAGKIILNELKYKVNIAGNAIIVYTGEEMLPKIVERLKSYKISIFNIEFITKSLEQVFDEIIQRKAINKNWLN